MMETTGKTVLEQATEEHAPSREDASSSSGAVSAVPETVTLNAKREWDQNAVPIDEPGDEFERAAERWPLAATGHG